MSNTARFHRVLRATPEKVYRAFLDADAMVKWLPPNGFTGKVHHLEAKVGGTYRMSFTNFSTGHSRSFGGLARIAHSAGETCRSRDFRLAMAARVATRLLLRSAVWSHCYLTRLILSFVSHPTLRVSMEELAINCGNKMLPPPTKGSARLPR